MISRRVLGRWVGVLLLAAGGVQAAPEAPQAATPLFSPELRAYLELSADQLRRSAIGLIEGYRAGAAVRQPRQTALLQWLRLARQEADAAALAKARGELKWLRREAKTGRAHLETELAALLTPSQRAKLGALRQGAAPATLTRQAACEGFIIDPAQAVDDTLQCVPAAEPGKPRRMMQM